MNCNKRVRIRRARKRKIEEQEKEYLFKIENLGANLNKYRLSGKFCDMTIKFNDKELKAHKIILASTLKYFESKLLNSFQYTNVVIMPDVRNDAALEAIITYAYTGQILLKESNVFNIYELADYLSEDIIKEACIDFLKTHMTKRIACLAYNSSISTEHPLLKNIAKQTIISNFADCSLSTNYLSLDLESLKEILSCHSSDSLESQQILFEGVLRWILNDVENRRTYVKGLLELIDINKLNTDYLCQYLSNGIQNTYSDIAKDIMSFYHAKSQQVNESEILEQSLMVLSKAHKKLQVQIYDFTEKKWSPVRDIISLESKGLQKVVVINNTVYYTTSESTKDATLIELLALNPTTMESKMLTSDSPLLNEAALCADTKKLYFCGGITPNNSVSDQVVVYDPESNSFETLPPMTIKRWDASAIFCHGYLYVVGGDNGSSELKSVEKYDFDLKTWTVVAPMHKACRRRNLSVLGGKLYACGGHESQANEVYEPTTNTWRFIGSMQRKKQGHLLVSCKGKLFSIGKSKPLSIEMYDPVKNEWQLDSEMSAELILQNCRGALIPTSCVSNGT